MLINRRMGGIAAGFIQMFTRADIIGLVKVAYARCLQFQALFHTAERHPLKVCFDKIFGAIYLALW